MTLKRIIFLFSILLSMVGTKALADGFALENADGVTIYYNYINDGKELEVIGASSTSGDKIIFPEKVVIPEEVTYMSRTRKVTSIGVGAFLRYHSLTSVTIPNSVTSIGWDSFGECSGLTSVTIGNSVKIIGEGAFRDCKSLTSVTIPNSVTSIGINAFSGCNGLTSVTIGNSVTMLGDNAFRYCNGLTSVTIPNSVTTIGVCAFYMCSKLTSVTIPNSVTTIESYAFRDCNSLTSVTIPNSVTYIGNEAFYGGDMPEVFSKIENPFNIDLRTFTDNTFYNAILYVPVGTIDKYKNTEGWNRFVFIEEGNGGGSTPTESSKCEKPTISYQNGKLTFYSATEGASYQYSITDSDIKNGNSQEVELGVTYNITVYATKDGYENSEIATATLCWVDVEPKTEGLNSVAQVRANAVMIKTNGGEITIEGADENTSITVYTLDGVQVGSATCRNGVAFINTNLKYDSIAIVKIGNKSVKVQIK